MTLDDIAGKLDAIDTRLSTLERKVDEGFGASGKAVHEGLSTLESKLNEGFNASKVRDEELHRLTNFGLEADQIVADSINRRLDQSNHKHDEQIRLLNDVIRQNLTKP
jgi:hypothetical protein